MGINRAQMRLQINIPAAQAKSVKEALREHIQAVESESWDVDYEATVLIDPGSFRAVDEALQSETRGKATMEVVSVAVVEDADESLM